MSLDINFGRGDRPLDGGCQLAQELIEQRAKLQPARDDRDARRLNDVRKRRVSASVLKFEHTLARRLELLDIDRVETRECLLQEAPIECDAALLKFAPEARKADLEFID